MRDTIEMAREAGLHLATDVNWMPIIGLDHLKAFEALIRADEREARSMRWDELIAKAVEAEREACAKVAGWLWQQFQDTKEAHERNSPEPFRPERFGFDQSTVQQSKRLMDAIRARGQA